ncbi:hypothetical protein [Sulfurimonas sp.]|uniref:hypothetical protein n=1 Tax=Sulfurimonas sp. TaxID=2022749 RepID=UPI003D0F564A
MSFMSNVIVAFIAYFINKTLGEFTFVKSPMIMINDLINFVEKKLYKNSVQAGGLFVVIVLGIMSFISIVLTLYLSYFNTYVYIFVSSFVASVFFSHVGLRVFLCEQETITTFKEYTVKLKENLVAPLLYILLFGIAGIILYKTIRSMDLVLKNKTGCYEDFSKITFKINEIIDFVPKKITLYLMSRKCKNRMTRFNVL